MNATPQVLTGSGVFYWVRRKTGVSESLRIFCLSRVGRGCPTFSCTVSGGISCFAQRGASATNQQYVDVGSRSLCDCNIPDRLAAIHGRGNCRTEQLTMGCGGRFQVVEFEQGCANFTAWLLRNRDCEIELAVLSYNLCRNLTHLQHVQHVLKDQRR
jgi:hypothetical protein